MMCILMLHYAAWTMRTTVNLDDKLIRTARRLTGTEGNTALVNEALEALVERESARRLARLAGSEPQLKRIRRRRPKAT